MAGDGPQREKTEQATNRETRDKRERKPADTGRQTDRHEAVKLIFLKRRTLKQGRYRERERWQSLCHFAHKQDDILNFPTC